MHLFLKQTNVNGILITLRTCISNRLIIMKIFEILQNVNFKQQNDNDITLKLCFVHFLFIEMIKNHIKQMDLYHHSLSRSNNVTCVSVFSQI